MAREDRARRFFPALHALALVLLSVLGVSLRATNLPSLQERYALDNDSYRFLRIAEAEVAGRSTPAVDRMRWRPEGRDMRTHLNLHAVMMARVYQVSRQVGLRIPFRGFALRYSILCGLLSLWVLYGLLARAVSPVAGLVAAAGMATAPAAMARSAAGFVDRDCFCLLLALGACAAYGAALRPRAPLARLAAVVLCALFSAILGLTWEGAGLITVLFALTLAWLAMSGRLTAGVLAAHLLWCALALPPLLLATHAYRNVTRPYAALVLLPVLFASLSALLAAAGNCRRRRVDRGEAGLAPALRFVCSATLLFAAGSGAALFLSRQAPAAVSEFLSSAISTLGSSRLMLSVAELRDMSLGDWWVRFGPSLALFLLGVEAAANDLGGLGRRGMVLGLAALAGSLIVLGSNSVAYVLGSLWPALPPDRVVAGTFRLAALVLWFGLAVLLGKPREGRDPSPAPARRFLLLTGWMVLLATTAGAERYGFFLAAAGWAAAGYGLSRLWTPPDGDASCRSQAQLSLSLLAILGLCLSLVGLAPLRFLLGSLLAMVVALALLALAALLVARVALVGNSGPLPAPGAPRLYGLAALGALALILPLNSTRSRAVVAALTPSFGWLSPALEQLDRMLPGEAVVLAWWDAGSQINVLARRATVIDEDHFRPERIEEVAREVYCASDPEQALRCLARLGVTHWLLSDLDMQQLGVQAWIGAGSEPAPPLSAYRFLGSRSPTSGTLTLSLPRPEYLQDPVALRALLGSRGPVQLHTLRLTMPDPRDSTGRLPDIRIDLAVGGHPARVTPEVVVFHGRTIHPHGPALPGTVLVSEDPAGPPCEATYFPPLASRAVSVRLFSMRERFPMFRPVTSITTPPEPGAPCGHRVAVWEVRY